MSNPKSVQTTQEPHKPIMVNEVMEHLNLKPHGVYVDCTFGAGGHAKAMLESQKDIKVIAIDRDGSNQVYATQLQKEFDNRLIFINTLFGKVAKSLSELSINKIDGILYDLGVSSMQLDQAERGFSFQRDGQLTMQMGTNETSAYDIVHNYSLEQLQHIIFKYGNERFAKRIANAIVEQRTKCKIDTTLQLADLIKSVVPKYSKIHPATKTFQAIRIETNNEIEELQRSLKHVQPFMQNGSRMCIITFHSLEERVVKEFIKSNLPKPTFFDRGNPNNWLPTDTKREEPKIKVITKKPITATPQEQQSNRRSRSAKIHTIEFL